MTVVYLDGEFLPATEAGIPATDQAVQFGRGIYETFRARAGRVFLLDKHVERLRKGAQELGIDVPEAVDRLAVIVRDFTERCGLDDARVRLTLTAGVTDGSPSLLMQARPATDYPDALYQRGMTATMSDIRRNETSPLSRFKSLNLLDSTISRERAQAAGADTAILLNTRGTIAEASTANIFIVRNDAILTPPVADGALPGVTRSFVLDRAAERTLTLDDLLTADEAFLTGAIMGVMPLVRVDDRAIGGGTPGAITEEVRTWYEAAACER